MLGLELSALLLLYRTLLRINFFAFFFLTQHIHQSCITLSNQKPIFSYPKFKFVVGKGPLYRTVFRIHCIEYYFNSSTPFKNNLTFTKYKFSSQNKYQLTGKAANKCVVNVL